MQKKKKQNVIFGSMKIMLAVALLAAISMICGKFLSFPQEGTLRFSVENLPILFAGIAFGPVAGGMTGLIADLLGCLLRGWAPLPGITLGAVVIGVTGGVLYRFTKRMSPVGRTAVPVFGAHLLGSVIVKSIGLSLAYGTPFLPLLGWRSLNYLIIAVLETVLLCILLRSKTVVGQLERMKR